MTAGGIHDAGQGLSFPIRKASTIALGALAALGTATPAASQPVRLPEYSLWSSPLGSGARGSQAPWSGSVYAVLPFMQKAEHAALLVADLPAASTTEGQLSWLHMEAGLTWEQLGRAVGVSRRAVHLWATGKTVSPTNVERVARLYEAARKIDAPDSRARLASLFAPREGRMSVYDEILSANASKPVLEAVTGTRRSLGVG